MRKFGCCLDDRTWRGYKDRQYVTALRSDKAVRDPTDLCRFNLIYSEEFHLHFLCKARYDRLMRSAIVIQSGGIMGIRHAKEMKMG